MGRLIILASFLLLFTGIAQGQTKYNVTGTWTGYQLQDPGGPYRKYYYEMKLKQKGKYFAGITYCSVDEEGVFCKIKVKGIIKDNVLYFLESEFLTDPSDEEHGLEWCRCTGSVELKTDGVKVFMTGTFTGDTKDGMPCIPGSVYLEKKTKRA